MKITLQKKNYFYFYHKTNFHSMTIKTILANWLKIYQSVRPYIIWIPIICSQIFDQFFLFEIHLLVSLDLFWLEYFRVLNMWPRRGVLTWQCVAANKILAWQCGRNWGLLGVIRGNIRGAFIMG